MYIDVSGRSSFSEKRPADEGVDLKESGGVEERLVSGVRGNYDQDEIYIYEKKKMILKKFHSQMYNDFKRH